VAHTDEVYLWLGVGKELSAKLELIYADPLQANVMLSYPLPEAEALLESKLEAAQSSLANCEEDLDFLREQITVSGLLYLGECRLDTDHMKDDGSGDSTSVQLGRE
jgi:hypothetical protein